MFIKEVLTRYRNDFSFVCGCEHCGHSFKRGDGYADGHFCLKVVPGQHCPKCGLNSYGDLSPHVASRVIAEFAQAANSLAVMA